MLNLAGLIQVNLLCGRIQYYRIVLQNVLELPWKNK